MKPLDEVTSDKLSVEGLAEGSGRALDNDTCGLEGGDLGVCATLASADNGTCDAWLEGDFRNKMKGYSPA